MNGTIYSSSEELRRALHWIAEERRDNPAVRTLELIEEASRRFNLSPAQEEWLFTTLGTSIPEPPKPAA